MEETKRALSVGQTESAEECAGARIEGERNSNPQKVLYHGNRDSSIPYEEYFPKTFGMGIPEKKCAWCGKVFCPTPEWVLGDCCKPTCKFRYDDMLQDSLSNAKKVVMVHSETKQDLMVFDNAQDAAGFVEKSAKDIRLVCNKLRQTAGGYAWRWADEKPIELVENVPTYVEEPKKATTVWIKESAYDKLKEIAKERGISSNKLVAKIIEKALKEYEI